MSDQSQDGFGVRTTSHDGFIQVEVHGELDASNVDQFQAALIDAVGPAFVGGVEIDLGGVLFMDSSGLRALIVAERAVTEAGATMRVTAASEPVRRLFEMTSLTEHFGLPSA